MTCVLYRDAGFLILFTAWVSVCDFVNEFNCIVKSGDVDKKTEEGRC